MEASRNIILLSDGAGDSRGKPEQTNVWCRQTIDPADAPTPLDNHGVASFVVRQLAPRQVPAPPAP
jgi:hypothetical protein